jgi:phage I-like protein
MPREIFPGWTLRSLRKLAKGKYRFLRKVLKFDPETARSETMHFLRIIKEGS